MLYVNLPNHRQQKLWGKEYIRTGGVCVHKTVKAPFTMATEVSYSCAYHVSAQKMYPPLNFAQLDSGYHQVARIYKAQSVGIYSSTFCLFSHPPYD